MLPLSRLNWIKPVSGSGRADLARRYDPGAVDLSNVSVFGLDLSLAPAVAFLAAVFAFVSSGISAVIGAWNARTVEHIRATAARHLERERAERDDRRKEVQPVLIHADRGYMQLLNAESVAVAESLADDGWGEPVPEHVPNADPAWRIAEVTMDDDRVRAAFTRGRKALAATDYSDLRDVQWEELNRAMRDLRTSARQYVHFL
jgi:hypothetical protein